MSSMDRNKARQLLRKFGWVRRDAYGDEVWDRPLFRHSYTLRGALQKVMEIRRYETGR